MVLRVLCLPPAMSVALSNSKVTLELTHDIMNSGIYVYINPLWALVLFPLHRASNFWAYYVNQMT